ncbi:MAG: hypothetical protein KTR15_11205, partial [Phycisphaeraceae bacterium]|nr:hypothetical protein [Phycisphaeraceae bacterium]
MGSGTKHICVSFEKGNGISSCKCPCTQCDQITAGESSSPRSELADNPIMLKSGGIVEAVEDIRIASNSFTFTHKREFYHLSDFWLEIGVRQGHAWTNALNSQMLMETSDPDRLNLILDVSSIRVFERDGTSDWFDGPDDSYTRIYHNTTEDRYEIINDESGEVLYFEDLDGTDGGTALDVFFMTDRMNFYGQQRLHYEYWDFNASPPAEITLPVTTSIDPYLKRVSIQRYESSAWVTDRVIDFVYLSLGSDDYLKEIRVWAGDGTDPSDYVAQWVRYTYYGESGLSASGDTGFFDDTNRSLIMVENYTAGTGQAPTPDTVTDAMDPADFVGNKVTMYRYDDSTVQGGTMSVFEADATERLVEKQLADATFNPGSNKTEYEALVEILRSSDSTMLDGQSIIDYASRTFKYHIFSANATSAQTVFVPAGENLVTTYGGTARNFYVRPDTRTEYRVASETVNTAEGGVRRDYYYIELNDTVVDPGPDVVRFLTIEDKVDATDNGVYRKVYGLNEQGILLREATILDPAGTPQYWCTSYIVGTSGRGMNKAIEHRPPSAHTKVDTAAELRKFLDPTGNSGANETDTLNGTTEGGRVQITDYTNGTSSYTVTSGVKDLATGNTHWLGYQHYVEYGTNNKRFYLDEIFIEPDFGTTTQPTPANTTDTRAVQYGYTFHDSNQEQIETRTVTAPVVTTSENGSGTATETKEYFDESGRLRWVIDGEKNVTYIAHDKVSGQRALVIRDIDTGSLPSEVTSTTDHWESWSGGVPTGFTTGSDSKLNLINTTVYDGFTRPRKLTDAEGLVSYIAYLGNETRVYPAWDGTTNKPLLPIIVSETDDAGRSVESFALDPSGVTVVISGGEPTGADTGVTQADYVSWAKASYNDFFQLEHTDRYYNIPSSGDGTAGSNYYRDRYTYDDEGRLEYSIKHVSGTTAASAVEQVTKVEYDRLSRAVRVFSGVSDTSHNADTGGDPTDFPLIALTYYDEATPGSAAPADNPETQSGVGDSLVTSRIGFYKFDAAETRDVDEDYYLQSVYHRNWRQQLRGLEIQAKNGASAEASQTPQTVIDVDNLGRAIASATYDAALTWSTVTGDVDYAASITADRRTLSQGYYDLLGQSYRTESFEVVASTGVTTNKIVSDRYFDRNGLLVAGTSSGSGGFEVAYDGALRQFQSRSVIELEGSYTSGSYNYQAPIPVPGLGTGTIAGSGGDDNVLTISHRVLNAIGQVEESITLEADHDDTDGLDLTGKDDFVQSAAHY